MPSTRPPFPVSDHSDGWRFFNPGHHIDRTWREVLRWRRTSKPAPWPAAIPLSPRPVTPAPSAGVNVTWIGHASFLLQTPTHNLLIDPVFSERASPFSWAGPRRVHPPGLVFTDLPPTDCILLSHDHYDHCDLPTLRRLARRSPAPRIVLPLGNEHLARRAGFPDAAISALDWWQTDLATPGLALTATPSRHWSNRLSGKRNHRLWSGFSIETAGARIHFVGDTGYDPDMFVAIRRRLGPPDLALVPIGAYEPRWFMAPQHCDPAEAVRIHLDLGARRSVAMHWGTFQLTDEARDEPPRALAAALAAAGLPADAFRVLDPGQPLTVPPSVPSVAPSVQ